MADAGGLAGGAGLMPAERRQEPVGQREQDQAAEDGPRQRRAPLAVHLRNQVGRRHVDRHAGRESERHAYVLDPAGGEVDKALHVSPFQPMDQHYSWSVPEPGEHLHVRLQSHEQQGPALTATLRLTRRPLTRRSITRVLLTHPPQPLRTLSAIYGQAARLRAKGAPYHPHPRTAA